MCQEGTLSAGHQLKISGVQAAYYFLRAVGAHSENSNDPWAVTLQLNETPMEFHIDTGAEVTVISEHASRQTGCPPLTSPQHTLGTLMFF